MNLIDVVIKDHLNANVTKLPDFKAGDTLVIGVKIVEGNKSRVQKFEGICIGIKNYKKLDGHFRVRKISNGFGVERIFPFHSPAIDSITVTNVGKSRRAKHYYLRDREGKAARIQTDYSSSAQ